MAAIFLPKRLVEIELCNFAAERAEALVNFCERQYQERLDAAAAKIQASGVRVVAVTGPSSSGKTTSSHRLAETLRAKGTPALVISLDNFFIGAANYPTLPDGTKDYESPLTLNMPEIHACIHTLCETGEVELPQYDFINECRAKESVHVRLDGGVCIIEGIHAFNPTLTDLFADEGIFRLYAGLREEYCLDGVRSIQTRHVRLCRRVIRDARTRGHSAEKTIELWPKVLESEFQYIKCYKQSADFVLDTSHTYENHLIAGQLEPLLKELLPKTEAHRCMLDACKRFAPVHALSLAELPPHSMLQEFYGV